VSRHGATSLREAGGWKLRRCVENGVSGNEWPVAKADGRSAPQPQFSTLPEPYLSSGTLSRIIFLFKLFFLQSSYHRIKVQPAWKKLPADPSRPTGFSLSAPILNETSPVSCQNPPWLLTGERRGFIE
jgi:hypothetical protein